MIQRRWLGLAVVVIAVAAASALDGAHFARSQTPFPEGAFVVGSDDTRWVVGGDVRYRISFVTDDAGLLPGLRDGGVVATIAEAQAALAGGPAPAPGSAPPPAAAANPAETLVGQRATTCSYGVDLELSVARVEWTKSVLGLDAAGNAMWVVAFLDVTNVGTKDESLYGPPSARVVDERGRQFDWRQYPPDPVELFRAYGVRASFQPFAPGVTEQTVAVFQVPGDVRSLTLEGKRGLCL